MNKLYITCVSLVCFSASVHAEGQESLPVPTAEMSFVSLERDVYPIDGQLQGIARPKMEALLRFPTIGQVLAIHATEGAWVDAGAPLVTLDDRVQVAEVLAARVAAESTANVLQAEIAAKRAEAVLERVLQAQRVEASSSVEVELRRSEYEQAVAVLAQQREIQQELAAKLSLASARHSQMTLSAPFAGQVVLIGVKAGNTVDTSKTAVQIADLSKLEVEMHLPSSLFGTLAVGESKRLRAGVPVGKMLDAQIRYVSPVIEPTGGTFLVRFEIDNQELSLPAGFEVWYR